MLGSDTHLELLDHLVSGDLFQTRDVLECDIAHRLSMAVLCIQYKIRCNPMHPLYVALLVPFVPVRVTRRALVAYRHIQCFSSLQNLAAPQDLHSSLSVSVARSDLVFDGVGLVGVKRKTNAFLMA